MSTLSVLKLTAAQKPTQMSGAQQRRNKLAKRVHEQIELLKAQQAGTTYAPIKFRTYWHSPNSVDKYYCQNLNGRNANAKSQIHS